MKTIKLNAAPPVNDRPRCPNATTTKLGNVTVDDSGGYRSVYVKTGTPEALALILTGLAKKSDHFTELVVHCHRGNHEEQVNRLFNIKPREPR